MDPYDQSNPDIPQYIRDELDKFREVATGYEAGSVNPDEFKVFRLQNGVYGQRQPLTHMLRVKIPSGILNPAQMRCLAVMAEQAPLGIGHVTTRQDMQYHFIPLKKIVEFKEAMATVGLTSREACGNAVRNVTASPYTGICSNELFDVTPYSQELSKFFLRNPVSQKLPRKFKPAFEGCQDHDHARTAMHDLGVIAAKRDQNGKVEYGFRVYVGGGLSSSPRIATLLEPFTPLQDLLLTSYAIVSVFDRLGERKNRMAARIKFLVKKLGDDEFRKVVFEEREKFRANPPMDFPKLPEPTVNISAPKRHNNQIMKEEPVDKGFDRWRKTNVIPQKQAGYLFVTVRLVRGDMTGNQMHALADISEKFCGGDIRTTIDQNMVLRWVKQENIAAVYNALAKVDLNLSGANLIEDITSCPGADTCNLGITSSRGLALTLVQMLDQGNGEFKDVRDIQIKISGCPNSCGQHHIADIGFYGASQKVGTRQVPAFQLMVGGNCDVEGAGSKFGRMVTRIPARRGPEAVQIMIDSYRKDKTGSESFRQYLQRVDIKVLKERLATLTVIEDYEKNPELYRDHGQTHDYKVTVGAGECAV